MTKKGFSLVELMVVITIIGILSAVALASFSEVKKNARDKARIADLEQAKAALQLYAVRNGTYHIDGTGSGGAGQGWFSYVGSLGGGYPASIADGLKDAGFLTEVLHDPLLGPNDYTNGSQYGYMRYFTTGGETSGSCLFAHLENPSLEQSTTIDNTEVPAGTISTIKSSFGMNYATCNTN